MSGQDKELARLRARPGTSREPAPPPGMHPLGLSLLKDGRLFVPTSYTPDRPATFALVLHGASGDGRRALEPLVAFAEEAGMVLLAPDARGPSWDRVWLRGWGPDVRYIDRALEHAFARFAVDPRRLVVLGFSDGASYALSLGLTNGDLFSHIVALSPGFAVPETLRGSPRVFVSQGLSDSVLPVDKCGRKVVSQMEKAGLRVRYREFDGGHEVPPAVAREAFDFFTGPDSTD
ncbi:alpha/beta hydrolase [Hyalangium rubrum]|uniref:Phospholipase n=1 Tax=Hyalangium rubrum TaxID=3103134 RepID=A0ABU5HD51_9BACT|nr:phospholipase [Hyalangium sp. s54d21]MDY7230035.1 phospholipase [Hyalangium sp. s54d21]